jgi:serine-type D-Ala-D-Ala carboxypeptidase (penicillin-binding protein 5/6)
MHADARPARRGTPRFTSALIAVAVLVAASAGLAAIPAHAETGTPPPEAFILVDAGTGAVITGRNMHQALPPASTAKIMTALVAVERLPPNATITVSSNAANREAMKIGMPAGARWPFRQVMASMMMVSANDAAYAVAETVGGSISGFAADLNATAKRYGMRDSTWGDPAGLTDGTSYEGGPRVSAFDLAIAARNALTVPAIAHWADTRTFDFTDPSGVHHSLTAHDKFLPGNGFGYAGANGFKTGYTEVADHTLVATAKRNGRQCIAVILGSVDSGYTWAASLLDQCWQKPPVATTGTFLPPVAVSPYQTRLSTRAAFTNLAVGSTGTALAAQSASTTTPKTTPKTTPTTTPKPAGAAVTTPATRAADTTVGTGASTARAIGAPAARQLSTQPIAASAHHSGGGLLSPTRVALLLVLALAVCVVLRRRAVKRQRARRIARQRARAKAMRSGSLPVVDGRYRAGTRVGQPVESRVRVKRNYIDLTKDDGLSDADPGGKTDFFGLN